MSTQEQRIFSHVQVRAAAGSDFALVGVAASYDTPSNPIPGGPAGNFVETIQRGAFTRSLRNKVDVKALVNHDPNQVLGRVKNGTLQLTDTDAGLAFRVQLDPKNQGHQNLYASVRRGDIDECSFAFTVPQGGDKWSRDYQQRTLVDVDLWDVSAVTVPAYGSGTHVQARNLRSGKYTVAQQDWHSRALAALAKLTPIVEADRAALAAERGMSARQQFLDAWNED